MSMRVCIAFLTFGVPVFFQKVGEFGPVLRHFQEDRGASH